MISETGLESRSEGRRQVWVVMVISIEIVTEFGLQKRRAKEQGKLKRQLFILYVSVCIYIYKNIRWPYEPDYQYPVSDSGQKHI